MRCITSHSPCVLILAQGEYKQHSASAKSHCLFNNKASGLLQGSKRLHSINTRVSPATLILAATSPPNSGDLSVLLQTSAVMLFMYWIANFVVPGFVLKDLQEDKANEDMEQDDQNP